MYNHFRYAHKFYLQLHSLLFKHMAVKAEEGLKFRCFIGIYKQKPYHKTVGVLKKSSSLTAQQMSAAKMAYLN